MRFPPEFIEQLRSRVLTSEVVAKRVRLVRKGREFSGLCPFHNEKTPSFTVNDEKSFYHCFGCGAHGDSIKFVIETMGLGYTEAVRYLADMAGMDVPRISPQEQQRAKRAATLFDVMDMACTHFQGNLLSSAGGQAREYLKKRGITREIVDHFRLGFSLDNRQALAQALYKKGITDTMLQAAGLQIKGQQGMPYDRFRGRVMFPITDSRNKVIAFGGRALEDIQPKYLNSPETELFHKGHILYAMAQARQAAFDTGQVIVSEGYMDVIAMHKAGFRHTVAPLGTAVTESHLAILWRMAKEPVLCLDGDQAGQRAMMRVAEMSLTFLKPGHSLRFAVLPSGMDPDDVLQAQGKSAMQHYIDQAMPLSEVLWQAAIKRYPTQTPEQKAALEDALMQYVEQIEDNNVQQYYRRFFKDKIWHYHRNHTPRTSASVGSSRNPSLQKGVKKDSYEAKIQFYEKVLLAIIVKYPEILADHKVEDVLMHTHITSKALDKMRVAILETKHFADDKEEIGLSVQDINQALESAGLAKPLATLRNDQEIEETFLLSANMDIKTVELVWERVVALHHLAEMEQEYQQEYRSLMQEVTPASEQRIVEIKKQIDIIKQKLDISI